MAVDNTYIGKENLDNAGTNYEVTLNFNIVDALEERLAGCSIELINSETDAKIELSEGSTIDFETSARTSTTKVKFTKASAVDGNYKFVLKDKNGKVITSANTTINTVKPIAVDANVARTGGTTGTFSVAANGVDAVKLYYVVPDETTSSTYTSKKASEIKTEAKTAGTVADLENNKVSVNLTNLTSGKSHTVYYVLESKYNTLSKDETETPVDSKIIPVNENVKPADQVTEPSAPEFKNEDDTKFKWTAAESDDNGYIIRIYDEAKSVVYEEKLNADTATFDIIEKLQNLDKEDKAGTYEAKIITVGDGKTNTDSEPKSLGKVTIGQLKPVTNVSVTPEEDGSATIKFDDSNEAMQVKSYQFKILKYDATESVKDWKEDTSGIAVKVKTEGNNKTYVIVSTDTHYVKNESYKVQVLVESNVKNIMNSKETVSEKDFYKLNIDTITPGTTTDSSVAFSFDEIKIANKTTQYSVETYLEDGETMVTGAVANYVVDQGTVKFTVTGLQPAKKYVFKIKVTVDGVSYTKEYNGNGTLVTVPAINNLIVGGADKKETPGYIYWDNSGKKLYINGVLCDVDTNDYGTDFETNIVGIIKLLKEKDVITVNGNTITLQLGKGEGATYAFATFAKEKVLDITIGTYPVTLTSTSASQPTEVTLRGTTQTYTINGLNADKIILEAGTKVATTTKDAKLVVKANSNTKTVVNDIAILAGSDTNITVNNTTKENIKVDASNSINGSLSFECAKQSDNVKILFAGKGDGSSTYSGTLNLDASNGATITVTQEQVLMNNLSINVTMNNGTVDLTDAHIVGKKNVKVTVEETNNSTLKVITDDSLPVELTSNAVQLVEDLSKELETHYSTNKTEIEAYIRKHFTNLLGTGAEIKTVKGSKNKIEITFKTTIDTAKTIQ